jgi:CubicO group peptidase (beta-lactamase class C family)
VDRRFDSHYGYGWFVPPASQGGTIFWHSGGVDGFQSLLYIDQPKGLIAILLGNGGEASVQVLNAVLAVVNKTYPD